MITKVIGAGLIIGVSGWAGLQKASVLSRRTRSLRQVRNDLEFLEKEISYAHTPLTAALEKTAAISMPPVAGLFRRACAILRKDRSIPAREAWREGLNSLRRLEIFNREDMEILALVGERLGASDVGDQVKMLRLVVEELKIQEEKARSREASEKKIWSYGGFIAGILICILVV